MTYKAPKSQKESAHGSRNAYSAKKNLVKQSDFKSFTVHGTTITAVHVQLHGFSSDRPNFISGYNRQYAQHLGLLHEYLCHDTH